MTNRYFDRNAGSDITGTGTLLNPWATYMGKFSGTGTGDMLYFKRGDEQVITTQYTTLRGGTAVDNRGGLAAYGDGDSRPRFSFPNNPGQSWGYVLNGTGRSFVTIENIDFDCATESATANGGILISSSGATAVQDWIIRNCRFFNNGAGPGRGSKHGIHFRKDAAATGLTSGLLVEDCDFFGHGEHGLIITGASNALIRRSRAWDNGWGAAQGGHGFSSRWQRTDAVGGWTLVSGNIYKRTLTASELSEGNIDYCQTDTVNRGKLVKNASTPTTPGLDQFGVSGSELFINIGGPPGTGNIRYAWGKCDNIVYEDCEAWGNIVTPTSQYMEGNGFALDDFTQNSTFRRCKSWDNQGRGFSINRGNGNRVLECVSRNNGLAGIASNTSDDLQILGSTIHKNNQGNAQNAAGVDSLGEVYFGPQVSNSSVKQSVIVGRSGTPFGVNDAAFTTGIVVDQCCIVNVGAQTLNTTPTNDLSGGDPKLSPAGGLLTGSPLLGAGTHVGYRRDVRKIQRPNPPSIGAYDVAVLRRVGT
jgi:hypothetical protein